MKTLPHLALLLLAFCFFGCRAKPSSDPVEAANTFFAQIGNGQIGKAYESATISFQVGQPFPAFQSLARTLGMTQPVQCIWSQTDAKDSDFKLKGEIVCADGYRLPATLTMVQERNQWRVLNLKMPKKRNASHETAISTIGRGGSFNTAETREVPSVATLHHLVKENLGRFNNAVQQRNFEDFYQNISVAWQKQITADKILTTFQSFIDNQIDLATAQSQTPVFDTQPDINTDGLLILNGHIPGDIYQVYFALQFNFETNSWKLFGIDVQIRQ